MQCKCLCHWRHDLFDYRTDNWRGTEQEVTHYAIFSGLLLIPTCSEYFPRHPVVTSCYTWYFALSVTWDIMFYTPQEKICVSFVARVSFRFWIEKGNKKYLTVHCLWRKHLFCTLLPRPSSFSLLAVIDKGLREVYQQKECYTRY
jgi:hypothetical protein